MRKLIKYLKRFKVRLMYQYSFVEYSDIWLNSWYPTNFIYCRNNQIPLTFFLFYVIDTHNKEYFIYYSNGFKINVYE